MVNAEACDSGSAVENLLIGKKKNGIMETHSTFFLNTYRKDPSLQSVTTFLQKRKRIWNKACTHPHRHLESHLNNGPKNTRPFTRFFKSLCNPFASDSLQRRKLCTLFDMRRVLLGFFVFLSYSFLYLLFAGRNIETLLPWVSKIHKYISWEVTNLTSDVSISSIPWWSLSARKVKVYMFSFSNFLAGGRSVCSMNQHHHHHHHHHWYH